MTSAKLTLVAAALALQLPTDAAEGRLHLDGLLIVRGDRTASVRVAMTQLGAQSAVMDGLTGRFMLDLDLGETYLLSFERSGMVTKLVIFDTHVPEDQQWRRFEFPFQVTLFHEGWNGIRAYAGPVGFVHYDPSRKDFVHRTDHTAAPGSPQAEVLQALVSRRALEAPVTPLPAPAEMAELIWERHGKRAGLWVGKAFTRDRRLLAQGQFIDAGLGERHGEFTFYHLNGLVESHGRYEQGRKVGVWQRFDRAGRPLADRIYDPGVLDRLAGVQAGRGSASPARDLMWSAPATAPVGSMADRIEAPMPRPTDKEVPSQHKPASAPASSSSAPRMATAVPVPGGCGDGRPIALSDAASAPHHAEPEMNEDGDRWEELIVERLRVVTVVRLKERSGHIAEYRRVANRFGGVFFFKDGLNIPASLYHAATGR